MRNRHTTRFVETLRSIIIIIIVAVIIVVVVIHYTVDRERETDWKNRRQRETDTVDAWDDRSHSLTCVVSSVRPPISQSSPRVTASRRCHPNRNIACLPSPPPLNRVWAHYYNIPAPYRYTQHYTDSLWSSILIYYRRLKVKSVQVPFF